MLSAKGLISSKPRQGIRIQPEEQWNIFDTDLLRWSLESNPSMKVLKEFLQMRIAIEPEAASLAAVHDWLRVERHDHNRGQSAAIRTGVGAARAPIVAVLDGDGQNDPADIPSLFAALLLSDTRMTVGDRRTRRDRLSRRISSRLANTVRASILHDGIRDTGCGLKVFYREDFLELPAFDHMHRFLPALMRQRGRKVRSVPVNHRPRRHGCSKYGIRNRLWAGIVDLLGVMWLERRRI